MTILELPVKFLMNSDEISGLEDLGIKSEAEVEDGILNVFLHHIETFNEDDDGYVNITFSSGKSLTVYMTIEDFKILLTRDGKCKYSNSKN